MRKTKCRTISLRLSEEEYREIKSRCKKHGVASVSEFVRAATAHALDLPELPLSPAFAEVQLSILKARVDRLDEQLGRLAVLTGVDIEQSE